MLMVFFFKQKGLFAKMDIGPATELFTETPFILVPDVDTTVRVHFVALTSSSYFLF